MLYVETTSEQTDESREITMVTTRIVDQLEQPQIESEVRSAVEIRIQAIRRRSSPRVRSGHRGAAPALRPARTRARKLTAEAQCSTLGDRCVTPTGRPSRAAVTPSLLAMRQQRRVPRRGETRQRRLLTKSTR
jgi:hypothetical protein